MTTNRRGMIAPVLIVLFIAAVVFLRWQGVTLSFLTGQPILENIVFDIEPNVLVANEQRISTRVFYNSISERGTKNNCGDVIVLYYLDGRHLRGENYADVIGAGGWVSRSIEKDITLPVLTPGKHVLSAKVLYHFSTGTTSGGTQTNFMAKIQRVDGSWSERVVTTGATGCHLENINFLRNAYPPEFRLDRDGIGDVKDVLPQDDFSGRVSGFTARELKEDFVVLTGQQITKPTAEPMTEPLPLSLFDRIVAWLRALKARLV